MRALAFDLGYSSVIDGKALILRSEDSFELSFVLLFVLFNNRNYFSERLLLISEAALVDDMAQRPALTP